MEPSEIAALYTVRAEQEFRRITWMFERFAAAGRSATIALQSLARSLAHLAAQIRQLPKPDKAERDRRYRDALQARVLRKQARRSCR